MGRKRSILLGTAACMVVLASSPAWAQETSAPAATDQSPSLIGELVITAEKRSQNIQDIPVAVSAYNSESREVLGITNVQDLTNFTPGLAYSTGTDRVTVRGVSRFTNNRSSEGGVALYVDGVYTSSTTPGNLTTLFLDRIEVLRGPQGTLYGRNSVGGAINFISKRPTEEFFGELRVGAQNYDRYDVEGAVSGAFAPNLRYRLAGSYSDQKEGFYSNLSGPSEGNRGRQIVYEAQIEGDAMDKKFEWWLKGQWVNWDNIGRGPGGRSTYVQGAFDTTTFINGVTPSSSYGFTGLNPGNLDPRLIDTDTPNRIDLTNNHVILNSVYHFTGFDVRYIGGYQQYDYGLQTDVDGTSRTAPYVVPAGTSTGSVQVAPGVFFPAALASNTSIFPQRTNSYVEDPHWHSQEINFSSNGDGPTQWIGGLYYFREGSNYVGIDARMPGQVQIATPILPVAALTPAAANPERRYAYNASKNVTWSQAVFGQVEHKFDERFKLTGGVRYTQDRRKSEETGRLICFLATTCAPLVLASGGQAVAVDITQLAYVAPTLASPDPSTSIPAYYDAATGYAHRTLRNKWDAMTGTLNLDFTPDKDTLIYAKYTRGYKAGGFNAGAFPIVATTNPEFINAYELGLKKQIGGRVQANASVFYYDYRDLQAPLTVISTSGVNRTDFVNLAKAEIKGIELETIYYPTDHLQLLVNYSYLDAQIKEACCFVDQNNTAAGAQNLAGNTVPSSTPHKVSVNANYTWDLHGGSLTASASYIWRSATYYSIFNESWNRAEAFGQADARIRWSDKEDKYTLIAFVRNLTNEEGHLSASRPNLPYVAGAQQYTLIDPRTYGIEIQRRFK